MDRLPLTQEGLTARGGTGMKNQVLVGYLVFKTFKYRSSLVRVESMYPFQP